MSQPTITHRARALCLVETEQEVRETKDRSRAFVAASANSFGKRMVGPMREGVSVDDEERSAHCYLCNNQSSAVMTMLTRIEVEIGM